MPTSAPEPLLEIAACRPATARSACCAASTSRSARARSWPCWAPTAPARRTLLRAISGLLPRVGRIRFAGKDMAGAGPRETVQAGLVHVVEGHRVFTQLSVFDNLLLAGYGMKRDERDGAGRGGAGLLSRNRREAARSRRHAVGRPAADAGGGAGPGAPAPSPDAGRALGRPVARAGRSRAGGRRAAARGRHRGAAGRAADRKGAGGLPTGSMPWRAARSCSKRAPTRPTCRTAWSTPISARTSARH